MSEKFALEIDGVKKFDISTSELVKKAESYFINNETAIPGEHRVKMASAIVAELGPENSSESLLRYSHPVFRPEMQDLIMSEAQLMDSDHSKIAIDLAVAAKDMDNADVAVKLAELRPHRVSHIKIAHDMDPYQMAYPEAGTKHRQKMMDKIAFRKVVALPLKTIGRILVKKAAVTIKTGNYEYYRSLPLGARTKLEELTT